MSGEYAIRAMLHLAGEDASKNVQIQDISKKWEIPENFLRKIVPLLAKAGLIMSVRGSGGGIKLAKSSEKITALNVIEAVEGKIFLNKCMFSDDICDRSDWCSMHEVWEEAQESLKKVLNDKSIAQLSATNIERIKNVSH
jgi:Rrf2 family transcriptional regulator, iron-sulfur cluster assembly transcription factor